MNGIQQYFPLIIAQKQVKQIISTPLQKTDQQGPNLPQLRNDIKCGPDRLACLAEAMSRA